MTVNKEQAEGIIPIHRCRPQAAVAKGKALIPEVAEEVNSILKKRR